MPLLSVRDVSRRFAGVVALDRVSIDVEAGQIAGLIGPNGAGKTTLFNVVSGHARPDGGRILFDGRDVRGLAPHVIARRGLARTFQRLELFGTMTVLENVVVAAQARCGWLRGRAARARAHEVLEYLDLGAVAARRASALPFATMRRVALARALASEPKLLLLDEPAAGLTREGVSELRELLARARREFGLTLVLVEHHMQLVMSVCERVHVLSFGRNLADGTPEEIQRNEAVVEAYLGVPHAAA